MKTQAVVFGIAVVLHGMAASTYASQDTIGPNGIDALGLTTATGQPLNGQGQNIGQVEKTRPGRPSPTGADNFQNSNPTIIPEAVYIHNINTPPPANHNIDNHAEYVAGVMISTDPIATGVATGANLYSSAYVGDVDPETQAAEAADFIATRDLNFVQAINFSFGVGPGFNNLNGNSLLTEFTDWSAARHDVLYVVAGKNPSTPAGVGEPTDTFNGITVASLSKDPIGVWSVVTLNNNDFSENSYSPFNRTFVSLLAPGDDQQLTGLGNIPATASGTSYAAPHVTATVALLQQYGLERSIAGDLKFGGQDWQRHEVMKAVLLNSANKIKDDASRTVNGIPVPLGGFLGMDRTVLDKTDLTQYPNGKDWLQSEAFSDNTTDGLTPLDPNMGAGALSARRALKQYSGGEYHNNLGPASIPAIGWDYQGAPGLGQSRKYQFAQSLVGGSFVSITVAYDRKVTFQTDSGAPNDYDIGDTFNDSTSFVPGQDQFNDLDLYLFHKGVIDFDNPVAFSDSSDSTIEHLFAQIPTTGEYEFWIYQFSSNPDVTTEHYAAAWWADAVIGITGGDYNGDNIVDAQDYNVWRGGFDGSVTPGTGADGNGNGVIDSADYVVWRKNRTVAGGGASVASVPEPSGLALFTLASVLAVCWRRR